MAQAATNTGETAFPPASLRVNGLRLQRGLHELMRDFSLEMSPGETLLITGRNGAGKTSLLRAIGGFLTPEAGEIHAGGAEAIAWLGHADGIKPVETPRQALEFWAKLDGRPRSAVIAALRAMGMDRLADRPAARLSRGQQRRAAIARLILQDRPLWLLDEPAGPLDGAGRDLLAEAVAGQAARGGIVIAATHQPLDWPGARHLELGAD
jgi:heme exporter protein A